jgi:hypothetical protein
MTCFADVRVLDLRGIGSIDVARERRRYNFDTYRIESLLESHKIELVIVYDAWYKGSWSLPESLVRVGTWTISNNVVCGDETVTFYGTTQENAERLRQALDRFSATLPESVRARVF